MFTRSKRGLIAGALAMVAMAAGPMCGSALGANTRTLHLVFVGYQTAYWPEYSLPYTNQDLETVWHGFPEVCSLSSSDGSPLLSYCSDLRADSDWNNIVCGAGVQTGRGTISTPLGDIKFSYEGNVVGESLHIVINDAEMDGYPTGRGAGTATFTARDEYQGDRSATVPCIYLTDSWEVDGALTITLTDTPVPGQ
jgi:hypothetical protein